MTDAKVVPGRGWRRTSWGARARGRRGFPAFRCRVGCRGLRAPALIVALALLSWAWAAEAQVASSDSVLRLGPGDGVRLVVENEPEMAADYPVGSDGRVLLPLVGGFTVAGRDFTAVERDIRDALGRELAPDLEIQVTPVFRMAVLGEVRAPGLLAVDPTMGVADVLAMAGGFSPSADRNRIQLLRGGRIVIETDEEGLRESAPTLRPGDRLMVGRRGWLRENLGVVIGAASSLTVAVITGLIVR